MWCKCSSLALHRVDLEARMGKPRKNTFYKTCFLFVFFTFLASHRGDIEARMGKPRKNTFSKTWSFRFFPRFLPDIEARKGGNHEKKQHLLKFLKRVFSFFPPFLRPTGVT